MLPFLTAYDPFGATSGSIDPLGALQPYVAMADRLLPGTSTITTRARYLSMLCAAIANAEKYRTFSLGANGFTERRQAVEPYERLWALACVAARAGGVEGAADGLRGVTAAEKRYRHFAANDEPIDLAFKLLKYQGRTGAVGTYWAAIVGSDLADPDSGTLTAEGHELAQEFPPARGPFPRQAARKSRAPARAFPRRAVQAVAPDPRPYPRSTRQPRWQPQLPRQLWLRR